MKSITTDSTVSNIVPAATAYAAGTYTLTGLVVGKSYKWTKGANDTNIIVNGSITLTATGLFTATATSVTLTGSGTSLITATVSKLLDAQLYESTFTPTQPVRQVTVGEFPENPNWSRSHQVSNEAHFVKRDTAAVAIQLHDFTNLALTLETGLTWTPPNILDQPASVAATATTLQTLVIDAVSEYVMSYAWQQSPDGTNWSGTIATGTGVFGVTIAAGGTGYVNDEVVTVNGGTGTSATLKLAVTGGVVTSASLVAVGLYSVNPSTPNSPTGGTGSGLSVGLTFAAFNVATAGSLKVTPASAGANYYRCVVTDDAGSYGLTNGSVTSDGTAVLTAT